jgi:hypothetical protein
MGNKQKPSGHKSQPMVDRYYRKVARPERFELPTTWFEGMTFIHSYQELGLTLIHKSIANHRYKSMLYLILFIGAFSENKIS